MLDHKQVAERQRRTARIPLAVTLVVTAVWTVGFSIRGVLQYLRFHTHAFDLGIFTQGTWLLSQVKEPFVTLRGLHLFADHSSYILVLVAPIYAVYPSAGTLIVITVMSLAACAPITYTVATRAGASTPLAAFTAVLVLIMPAVQWQIHGGFHPEVLVIPLTLAAVALLQRDRSGWAIAALAVALSAKEDVALLVVPLGIAVVFLMGKRRTGWTIVAMGVGAFVLNFFVLLPLWSPTGDLLYSARYSQLGDSPLSILWGLATSPEVWVATITSGPKLGYVAGLVLAMPLSLLGWRWLLVGLPVLASNVLSLHHYQYRIQSHYTAYLIVVVAVAAAHGAARFTEFGRFRSRGLAIGAIAIAPVILWATLGPVTVWARPHGDTDRIANMLEHIPDDGAVAATTTFTPQLANREQVYVFPNPWIAENYGVPGGDPADMDAVDWVAIRTDVEHEFESLVIGLTASGAFAVEYEDGPFLLLRRVSG